jgi:hypothetical protein
MTDDYLAPSKMDDSLGSSIDDSFENALIGTFCSRP